MTVESQNQLNPPLRIFPADEETIRWNYPSVASVRSVASTLVAPSPYDHQIRERNQQRGSLFQALVDFVASQLDDRPCYVELSGGCDSSLVLSAAHAACRQVDHESPISLTFRFPLFPETDESEYQLAVLDFLRLEPGRIIPITDEFDLLGPTAQRCLKLFGPVFPAPAFSYVDVMRELPPGIVLSGEGGDESFGPRRISGLNRAADAVKQRKLRSVAGNVLHTIGPRQNRAERILKRNHVDVDWIDVREVQRFAADSAQWWIDEPLRPSKFAEHYQSSPGVQLAHHQLSEVLRWCGHHFVAPLMSPQVVHAVTELTPWWKLRDRSMILNHHFASHLPTAILNRKDKRAFQPVYFNHYAKEFAHSWSGQIEDPFVSAEKLRAHWLQADPYKIWNCSLLLLQKAWLTSEEG
jgi:asparagine synthetase B (glutamine-hydrolysing)